MTSDETKSETKGAMTPKSGILNRLMSHVPPGQFLRYLVVGGWNTAFGYSTFAGIYYMLHFYDLPAANLYWQVSTAQIISVPINFTGSYLCYKFFVFKTKGNYLREWLKSIAVYGSSFLPGLVLLPLLVKALLYIPRMHSSAPYVANALLMGVVVIYSFLGHKHITFKVSPGKPPESRL
jgi:putative flippase GtrA